MFHHSQSQMPQENMTMASILASSSATFNLTELELTSPLGLYFQIASISLQLCVCPGPNCSQVLFCTLFEQVADYITQLPIQPPWNMPRANLYLPSHRTPYTPKVHFSSAISQHAFPPGTTGTIQCLANFLAYGGAHEKSEGKVVI